MSIAYRDLVLSRNPVAYWRLGESAGPTAVDEVSATDLVLRRRTTVPGSPLQAVPRDPDIAQNGGKANAPPPGFAFSLRCTKRAITIRHISRDR